MQQRKHDHFYATYHLLKVRVNNASRCAQPKPAMIDRILLKIK